MYHNFIILIPGRADPLAPLIVKATDTRDAKRYAANVLDIDALPAGSVAIRIASAVQS